ncbi:hypothetical protein [Actinacidiphila rubida]|uniref:Uncharacterized protein n=1 Tax=Actinacidiphila rubida TaxID=310780 RepID=A0A1H8SW29_9ACTN|nr:hypothetical protein [Actinacidiphila rubida]SEO82871.1 hypothetical protein SAMN05216267_104612 [Actinacidiphila rubida]
MSAYLICPAGGDCLHREEYDPAHQTASPDVPADGDRAHDALAEHLLSVHDVKRSEVGRLVSQARRVIEPSAAAMARFRMSQQQRAEIRARLGGAQPAADGLLESFGKSVADMLGHDHKSQREDWYCVNLAAYMGERSAPVLRRLLDAEAEAERLQAELAKYVGHEPTLAEEAEYVRRQRRAEVLTEAAEVAVRAARGCGDDERGQYAASVAAGVGAELRRMAEAGKDTREGESTQPADFFQPGHAYTHHDGSDFECVTVAAHPNTGEQRAFGWRIRNGRTEGATLDPDDWQQYDGCQPPADEPTRTAVVMPALAQEGSCTGIALNGVHTQVFHCRQAIETHELHLWRTGTEWFTCRGEAR